MRLLKKTADGRVYELRRGKMRRVSASEWRERPTLSSTTLTNEDTCFLRACGIALDGERAPLTKN